MRALEGDLGPRAAGCWAQIEAGHVVAAGAGRSPCQATTWAQGTIDDWLAAVIDRRSALLKSAGEPGLGKRIVGELHARLFDRH